ncbi:MAG: MBL fold metallo-hydrolase [Ruthenibacterium sp.]
MKLTFIGADHEVTGSCTLLEACGKNILVDYGMEQGSNEFINVDLPINPAAVDCVLLTHAHIDHSGLLPLLYKNGFRGVIYATAPTVDLCKIMLQDSAHIQEFEAEWKNRKALRAGAEPVEPLYTVSDALGVVTKLIPVQYGKKTSIFDGVCAQFIDAGHLLGSASIEVWLEEDGVSKKLVFSGDIGNVNQPIIRDPSYLKTADYVVMESTYGDRSHGPVPDYISELTGILQQTFDRGGNVIVPSFAVGRTQEMLYFLRKIKADNLVKGHDGFTVYVDSPLANEATAIFKKDLYHCYDDETRALIDAGINPIGFVGLKTSVTSDDSKAINFDTDCKVIVSASGMCDAGRIKHHLKHNLWRQECTVLFVGYQSVGTLGRSIVDGAKEVHLFGEKIEVKAEIRTLTGISGHADNEGLLRWAKAFETTPVRVFVNHGEASACETLTARLVNELHMPAVAPYSGDAWDLASDRQVETGSRKRVEKGTAAAPVRQAAFTRLLAAAERLKTVAAKCEGMANKELAKFADQINALCDKWMR